MKLDTWIRENTLGSKVVVEFGAGFFQNLSFIDNNIKKIGIEIWYPYIQNAKYNECIKIFGDIRNYKSLINENDMDCALLCDILEHFDKEIAISLIKDIMNSFNKTLLMIPEGKHDQTKDVTGYEAHTYQTHRSTWYTIDIEKLGFDVTLDPYFHTGSKNKGCIFAKYEN